MAIIETDAEPIPDLNIPADQIGNYEVHVFPTVPYINDAGQARNPGTLEDFGNRSFATVWKFSMSAPGSAKQIDAGAMESTPPGVTFAALIVNKTTGRKVADFSVFGRGFRVPSSPTSTTWPDIGAYNRGIIAEETQSANVSGPLTVGGLSTFNGDATFNATVQLNGPLLGLQASAIPGLDASIIETGQFVDGQIESADYWNDKVDASDLGTMAAQDASAVNITGGNITGTLAGPGGGITGIVGTGGPGGNRSTAALSLIADTDNTGGAERRIDLLLGTGGSQTAPVSITDNGIGVRVASPGARLDVGGGALGDAAYILRWRTKDPGGADIGLVYQSAHNNVYTPANPIWAGTYDHVFQLGYNVGPTGKQVSGEHLFAIVNESSYTVGDGSGRTQDEFYIQYISRDGSYNNRPFSITTDLDNNNSIALFSNTGLAFATSGGNAGTVIGDKIIQFNTGGVINFINPTTDPMITSETNNVLMRTPVTGELNILEGGSNNEKLRLFASDGYNVGDDMRLIFGSGTGAGERGFRMYNGILQYTLVNPDIGSLSWQRVGNQQTEDGGGRVLTNTNPLGGAYLSFTNQNGAHFSLALPANPYADSFTRLSSYGGFIFQTGSGDDKVKIDASGLSIWDGSTWRAVAYV
jgi:hypothetical protein